MFEAFYPYLNTIFWIVIVVACYACMIATWYLSGSEYIGKAFYVFGGITICLVIAVYFVGTTML